MKSTRLLRALLLLAALILTAARADALDYDHSPVKVLFIIDTRGGFASPLQELTSLPEFVLYGDGSAVWTRYDRKKDLRVLMTARLGPDEMARELAYIESVGFLGWYDRYDSITLPNMPTTQVQLNLKDRSIKRMAYGLQLALKQKKVPEGFGELYEHFTTFRHKDEYEYPIDHVRLFARRLGKAEAKRGYKTLNWGIKQVVLADVGQSDTDYGQKDLVGKDAERIVDRLRDWTMFSTDLSVIFFKEKKDEYQVGYRPILPHE